ncbi:MAG: class I poly(R)-hydroxyalkanoic acid synthase [Myxococcota bacterium]
MNSDTNDMTARMVDLTARSQRLFADFVARNMKPGAVEMDEMELTAPLQQLSMSWLQNPEALFAPQRRFLQDVTQLWMSAAARTMGLKPEPVIAPPRSDRRFRDPMWTEAAIFDFIKQSYLLTSRFMQGLVDEDETLDPADRQRLSFATRQILSGFSPSNFVMTNPVVLNETIERRGENLIEGFENLLRDLEENGGQLRPRMSRDAFTVGDDLATTPGKVVYENTMMQLIQYTPATSEVYKRPLLIIPPWINKYYILDLRAKNSFIRFAVERGFTVFIISWVNPDERHKDKGFEDYMLEGPIRALDAIADATGQSEVNLIGYCIGGTLTASTLAYLKSKGDERVKSVTYFTSLVDFEDAGEIKVFTSPAQLDRLEQKMMERGYLDAREMGDSFRRLRENDLLWSYVVDQYLLGRSPTPFDLLYWNEDSTNMPAKMHSFYLRNMYQHNRLVEPGGLTLDGVPIDLRTIEIPTMIVSTEQDHIAPWKSTYKATQLYQGPVAFVLGGSGHIAGVVNPPSKNKYGYRINTAKTNPADPDAWLAASAQKEGSWWPHWAGWLSKRSGRKVKARFPGDGKLDVIEDAPGRYVMGRG